MKAAILIALALFGLGECYTACPKIKGVANLDVKKFSGIWQSVYESSQPKLPCLSYELNLTSDGNLNTRMIPYQLQLQGIFNDKSDSSKNLKMVASLDHLNGIEFTIVYTDYVNSTAIFTCNPDHDFQSITFMSRTTEISKVDLEKFKGIYNKLGLDELVSNLTPITRNPLICIPLKLLGNEILKNAINGIEKVKCFINTFLG